MTTPRGERNGSDYFLSAPQYEDDNDDGQLTPVMKTHLSSDNTGSSGSLLSRFKQAFKSTSAAGFFGYGSFDNPRVSHRKQSSNVSSNTVLSDSSHMPLTFDPDFSVLTPRRRSLALDADGSPGSSSSASPYRPNATFSMNSELFGKTSDSANRSESLALTVTVPLTSLALQELGTISDDASSPALTSSSDSRTHSTPPLTPDLLESSSSKEFHTRTGEEEEEPLTSHALVIEENSGNDIGKGKDPAPPFVRANEIILHYSIVDKGLQPYETLLADITSVSENLNEPNSAQAEEEVYGEWWGLDYTIELSRRGSRASNSSVSTGGEHSKVIRAFVIEAIRSSLKPQPQSRESWAAIHQGSVPRQNEDSNFCEWLRWHHNLESLDMKRRRKRTFDFLQNSDRLSRLFVDELFARIALELYVRLSAFC